MQVSVMVRTPRFILRDHAEIMVESTATLFDARFSLFMIFFVSLAL